MKNSTDKQFAAIIKLRHLTNAIQTNWEMLGKTKDSVNNLLDANKYRAEYLQAVKEIEEEANKKDNLWDRFLNFLAGNIPFKQTPEKRVMMRRWLEGERGEL